ncbi:hypothetical protein P692DRAFT_20712778 [Suillus brevipes Sb2]|nr:hypothetical protein P692DRAFT_20712778 [Suillus brevipes Sb2]
MDVLVSNVPTVLDLRTDAFAHAQLYTALSRVRNHCDTQMLLSTMNEEKVKANVVETLRYYFKLKIIVQCSSVCGRADFLYTISYMTDR